MTENTGRLADKVAIVTGGNSGMGAGTVELFVAEFRVCSQQPNK